MRAFTAILATFAAAGAFAGPAGAQLGLPAVPAPGLPRIGDAVEGILPPSTAILLQVGKNLADLREKRLARLLREQRSTVDSDLEGNPARRGELLVVAAQPATLAKARAAGFAVISQDSLDSLGFAVTRLQTPPRLSLAEAETALRRAAPEAEIAPDAIHFQAGPPGPALQATALAAARPAPVATRVGMIDGAPGQKVALSHGFASGAPRASDHGSAVASLLAAAGVSHVLSADVYGSDPAGGNALAIARGIDWLARNKAQVVTISLVGPRNAVLEKAVAAARKAGIVIVAAVGNDGPAAPPSYPASYPGVVAVTAVDGRRRPLLEAGRALHLDYAAPGADMRAANKGGKLVKVRGTSFAAPLVAGRIAAALDRGGNWQAAVDGEAEDLGPRGPDREFGRGLLCGGCIRR